MSPFAFLPNIGVPELLCIVGGLGLGVVLVLSLVLNRRNRTRDLRDEDRRYRGRRNRERWDDRAGEDRLPIPRARRTRELPSEGRPEVHPVAVDAEPAPAAGSAPGGRTVRLDSDIAAAFVDEAAVNAALREYLRTHPKPDPAPAAPVT